MTALVLALDTSTAATVVGLATTGGEVLASAAHVPSEDERPGHASQLLALADDALASAQAGWQDIERLGIGAGPGGFTGLRLGIATGLGLAAATGAQVVPVSSLDALALAAGSDGPVVAVLDARRSEVFARRYGPHGQAAGEPLVCDPAELDVGGSLVIGEGARRYAGLLRSAGGDVPGEDDPRHELDGAALARLALLAEPAPVTPVYLREPDAKPRRR